MCTSWVNMGDNVLEGWIAGASMDYLGRITGLFFHTTDGGITYTLHQVYIISLIFNFILFNIFTFIYIYIYIIDS